MTEIIGKRDSTLGPKTREPLLKRVMKKAKEAIPLPPLDLTLRFPETMYKGLGNNTDVNVRITYAMLMGFFIDRGEVFQVLNGDSSQISLSETPPLPLSGPTKQLVINDQVVQAITGEKPPESPSARKSVQKKIQSRFLRAANFWRTNEGVNSIIIKTSGQEFPATMDGIDEAWESHELPDIVVSDTEIGIDQQPVEASS